LGQTVNGSIDRQGGAVPAGSEGAVLARARRLFAEASAVLEREIADLSEISATALDETRIKAIADLIRHTQKALMMTLEIEARLAREANGAGQTSLDLDDARAEIARRLARLAE